MVQFEHEPAMWPVLTGVNATCLFLLSSPAKKECCNKTANLFLKFGPLRNSVFFLMKAPTQNSRNTRE